MKEYLEALEILSLIPVDEREKLNEDSVLFKKWSLGEKKENTRKKDVKVEMLTKAPYSLRIKFHKIGNF